VKRVLNKRLGKDAKAKEKKGGLNEYKVKLRPQNIC
jgi:hypothetical protein